MSTKKTEPSVNRAVNQRFTFSRDIFAIHTEDGSTIGAITIGADSLESFEQIFKEASTYFKLIDAVAEHMAQEETP